MILVVKSGGAAAVEEWRSGFAQHAPHIDVRWWDDATLRPEMVDYTIYVDGISKAFAATGVRVGWVAGPGDVIQKMTSLLAHVGAWAPRAEQVATAKLLSASSEVEHYSVTMKAGLQQRLDTLYAGVVALRKQGFPVTKEGHRTSRSRLSLPQSTHLQGVSIQRRLHASQQ